MQDQVGREPHTGPCQHSSTQLKATSGRVSSNRRPKVAAIRSSLNASSTILDGEMLVIGKDGRLSFNLVQRRCPAEHPTMFDALEALPIIGTDTVGMPYLGRQALLTRILEPEDHWKTPAHHVGHTASVKSKHWCSACQRLQASQRQIVLGGWQQKDIRRCIDGHHLFDVRDESHRVKLRNRMVDRG